MHASFVIRGRLGNAIFRYMACAVLIINYDYEYSSKQLSNPNMSDDLFLVLSKRILNGEKLHMNQSFNMANFYQHDLIYKKFKKEIINLVNNNKHHIITTDGITAGDMKCQEFKMYDIVNTPIEFSKTYKNVLHVRLEDFITHNLYLKENRILDLLDKGILNKNDELCVVCKAPTEKREFEYLETISKKLSEMEIKCTLEHNDILTDYYICKEAELLICSKSTLSWCAAFFSTKIKKCFMPDYKETVNQTCKRPIDNTDLY